MTEHSACHCIGGILHRYRCKYRWTGAFPLWGGLNICLHGYHLLFGIDTPTITCDRSLGSRVACSGVLVTHSACACAERYEDSLLRKLTETVQAGQHSVILVDAPLLKAARLQAFWTSAQVNYFLCQSGLLPGPWLPFNAANLCTSRVGMSVLLVEGLGKASLCLIIAFDSG